MFSRPTINDKENSTKMEQLNEIVNSLASFTDDRIQSDHAVLNEKVVIGFGEDSLRYDFFTAVKDVLGLQPKQIRLENAYPAACFNQIKETTGGRGRKLSKPEIDMEVLDAQMNPVAAVEFALFKRTAIAEVQAKPANAGKMFSDITRLAALRLSEPYKSSKLLFIVLTDQEMLEYGFGSRGRKATPIFTDLELSSQFLSQFPKTTTEKIPEHFTSKLNGKTPVANIVYSFEGKIGRDELSGYKCFVYEVDLIE